MSQADRERDDHRRQADMRSNVMRHQHPTSDSATASPPSESQRSEDSATAPIGGASPVSSEGPPSPPGHGTDESAANEVCNLRELLQEVSVHLNLSLYVLQFFIPCILEVNLGYQFELKGMTLGNILSGKLSYVNLSCLGK